MEPRPSPSRPDRPSEGARPGDQTRPTPPGPGGSGGFGYPEDGQGPPSASPRPPADPYPYAAPPGPDPAPPPYGSPYGGQPDPFGGSPVPPYAPDPPQPAYPSYPTSPSYPPPSPQSPYDQGRPAYPSPFETPNPYEEPPGYGAPPRYGQYPYDPAPQPPYAPQPAPAALARANGAAGKRNGGTGGQAAPRRRRRSNRGALIGVGAVGLIILVGLIAFAFMLFDDDDDGGGGGETAAGAAATQTRGAELAALAALTPVPEPTAPPVATATAPPDDEAEAPPADDAAAAGSDEESGEDEDAAADDVAAEDPPADEAEVTLTSFLPGDGDMPDGFVLDEEGTRDFTEEEVAVALGNEEESATFLDEAGWREGGVRQYNLDGEAAADDTSVLIGSAHRFGSSSAANEALTYFSDAVAGPQELEDIEVETIGDETRALSGQTEVGANQVILYIRSGPYLLRVAGTSAEGNPTEAVVALAQQIVEG